MFVEADIVFIPLRNERLGGGGKTIFFRANAGGDVEVDVSGDVPAKKELERREAFVESLSKSDEGKMLRDGLLCQRNRFVISISSQGIGIIASPRNELSLHVVVLRY